MDWDRARDRDRVRAGREPRPIQPNRQPATDRQLRYIAALSEQLEREPPIATTRQHASQIIDRLKLQVDEKKRRRQLSDREAYDAQLLLRCAYEAGRRQRKPGRW